MLYIFIAVFIVLVIMNVFMIYVLKQMASATGKQIEKDAARLMAVYDELLEERSRRLEEMEMAARQYGEEEQLRMAEFHPWASKAPVASFSPVIGQKYQDDSFTETYQKIKREFQFDSRQVIARVLGNEGGDAMNESNADLGCMKAILEKISFESLYEIAILPLKEQKGLFQSVLEEKEYQIFEKWCDSHLEEDAVSFMAWLKNQVKKQDDRLVIRTGTASEGLDLSGEDLNNMKLSDMKVETDPSVCEGMKVLRGDKLYDYSISWR